MTAAQEGKLLRRCAYFLKAQHCHLTREYENTYSKLSTSPNAEGLKINHHEHLVRISIIYDMRRLHIYFVVSMGALEVISGVTHAVMSQQVYTYKLTLRTRRGIRVSEGRGTDELICAPQGEIMCCRRGLQTSSAAKRNVTRRSETCGVNNMY